MTDTDPRFDSPEYPEAVHGRPKRSFPRWFAFGCADGPHRGPEGPNEDISQCGTCWAPSHALRPAGETFGRHQPDCSLPLRHESYCAPGGSGHPDAKVIRG
jgi:hypothetical protein